MWLYTAALWIGCGVITYSWMNEPHEVFVGHAVVWVGFNVLYVGLMLAQWLQAINRQLAVLNMRLLKRRGT